ncbi:MAG TPA: hypothetical protein VKV19_05595 [Ktedonobacteraceae bacterium]|jgi:hypothetical protein|nr:hypothetical protein [Ktedonobacteraceae bacterium]
MALEDYLEPEVAVAAVVTAAIFSPRARKFIRRGAVYGMAGILKAGDAVTSFASSIRQGVQEAGASTRHAVPKSEAATEGSAANTTHKRATTKASAEGAGGA